MSKNKHDHTATKKIKAWLFAIMLLLPFLFLLPTGLYYGLNQNAQLSERTETNYFNVGDINEEPLIFIENQLYGGYFGFGDSSINIQLKYVEIVDKRYTSVDVDDTHYNYIQYNGNDLNIYTNGYVYGFSDYQYEGLNLFIVVDETISIIDFYQFGFDEIADCYNPQLLIPNGDNTTYTNDISTSIINAWNSTWQNPLFSWTNYSPFYAPMQSFTNVFGINDMQIANVLTYLATITAIYIVFDIVIELFTYLTHLIPRSD